MNIRPRIIYMGTPEFAVAPLKRLIEEGFDIAGVVTVPDKPGGRGLKINESDVKKYYLSSGLPGQGVPLLQPVSLKDPRFLEELEALRADLFIVVAFRMLPEVVWKMPELGTFNLHGSLLPKYRGAAPVNWAIIRGEQESGVTTFLIDENIDTGNILMQRTCPITGRETIGTLYEKLMHLGAELVTETVRGLQEGRLQPQPQQGATTHAPKLTKETGKLRWATPQRQEESLAVLADRLVRGLSPYPAATAAISNGEKTFDMKVFDVSVIREKTLPEAEGEPGRIRSDNKTYIHAVCGDGSVLSINDLQIAGKKRMPVREFLMGFRNIETYKFI